MSHDFTRRSFLSAATGASALAFGIGTTGARQGPTYTLAMTQDGWVGQSPSEIQGQNAPTLNPDPGQEVTVEWENRTNVLHNFAVTRQYPGGNALFRSDYVASGDSQTVTFTAEQGLAAYYCENHTDEMGNIVVGEGQQTTTAQNETAEDPNLTQAASEPAQTFEFVGSVPGWQATGPSSISGQTNPTLRLVPGRLYAIYWINGDGAPHNVEIENDQDETMVRSDVIERGGARQTVKFVAREDMSVYYCQYHPISMRGEIEIVSEDQVTQQTATPAQETVAPGQQTTVQGEGDFTHQTVSRDLGQENATRQTTAPGGPTTVPAQETTTMAGQQAGAGGQTTTVANQANAGDGGGVDTDEIVQTVRAPGFGALTALGGLGGAMGYLLSRGEDDEE